MNSNANAARARQVDRLGDEEFTPFASMNIGGRAPKARPAATASSGILRPIGATSSSSSSSNRNPALPPVPNARADRAVPSRIDVVGEFSATNDARVGVRARSRRTSDA